MTRKAYGGDPFTYDLEAALAATANGGPDRQAVQAEPPTRDELVRHLEKFGPDGVEELPASTESTSPRSCGAPLRPTGAALVHWSSSRRARAGRTFAHQSVSRNGAALAA